MTPAGRPRTAAPFTALAALAAAALVAACGPASTGAPPAASGALEAEVARWSDFAAADTAGDPYSSQVRRATAPALEQARTSLARGRRLHALLRLGAARSMLSAVTYMREHRDEARSQEALEAVWKRAGAELAVAAPGAPAFAGIRPAAVRAMAEAAGPAVRISYEASLVYARATDVDAGLFYMGEAEAHRQFVELCRSLGEPAAGRDPAFRAIGPEIDALQSEILALYKPPVSIDRHPEFIGASAALKEARELDAAGLRRGALLRYLQAALRFQPLRDRPPAFDSVATPAALHALAARLGGGLDHSLGRLFLEVAQADLEDTSAAATHATAAAVAGEVLPRYFAALEAAPRATPAAAAPQVTVTLVRWPYT